MRGCSGEVGFFHVFLFFCFISALSLYPLRLPLVFLGAYGIGSFGYSFFFYSYSIRNFRLCYCCLFFFYSFTYLIFLHPLYHFPLPPRRPTGTPRDRVVTLTAVGESSRSASSLPLRRRSKLAPFFRLVRHGVNKVRVRSHALAHTHRSATGMAGCGQCI